MPKIIATKTFEADLISQGSWGSRDLGKHKSTMELYQADLHLDIEWDVPGLETTESIGLDFEWSDKHKAWSLIEYDGVFSLPSEAVQLLRENGYHVPKDME